MSVILFLKKTNQHNKIMSDVIVQQCAGCKAFNVSNNPDWIRTFGIYKGAPKPRGQNLVNLAAITNLKPVTETDLCPTCLGKNTIVDLIDLVTPPKPAAPATANTSATT
jgi:hypothetical protein